MSGQAATTDSSDIYTHWECCRVLPPLLSYVNYKLIHLASVIAARTRLKEKETSNGSPGNLRIAKIADTSVVQSVRGSGKMKIATILGAMDALVIHCRQ